MGATCMKDVDITPAFEGRFDAGGSLSVVNGNSLRELPNRDFSLHRSLLLQRGGYGENSVFLYRVVTDRLRFDAPF